MPDDLKFLVVERNGAELPFQEEEDFLPENMPFSDPGFTADNVDGAIKESHTSAVGGLFSATFITQGNTADKWAGYVSHSSPSNEIPYILPQDSALKGLTFSNMDNDVDIDIEIYKNGVLFYTWEVRNSRMAWKVGLAGLSFTQVDHISCFMRKYTGGTGDSTAQDPIVELLLKITNEKALEGKQQSHG